MPTITKQRIFLCVCSILVAVMIVWGLQLLRIKNSVTEYSYYWSTQKYSSSADAIIYLAMGDSAAQSIGASSPNKGYVGLLTESISERYSKPVQIINVSVSGARLSDLIQTQLSKIEKINPDIITVTIGSNDIKDYDKQKFASEINVICDALPDRTIIATLPYFGHGQAGKDAHDGSKRIEDCARRNNLVAAPLYSFTEERGYIGMFTDYGADFFHPNDRGYIVWAKAFDTVLPDKIEK